MLRGALIVGVAAVTTVFPTAGNGQAEASRTARSLPPLEVARTMLNAMIRGDYLAIARRTDPAELRRNRAAFDSLLLTDSTNYLARRLFRKDSVAQVRALSDAEFTAALMEFQLGLRGARQYFAVVQGVDLVGALPQGPDTTHVVYRWMFPPDSLPLRTYLVETLVRCGPDWCAHMAGSYTGLVKLLKEPMVRAGGSDPRRP